jgi:hypothetical protein
VPLSCLTNREIGRIIGTSEEGMKIQLRNTFDRLGVWSRLELAMYVASHGGKRWKAKPGAPSVGFSSAAAAGWRFFGTETFSPRRDRDKTDVLEKPGPGGPLRGLGFLRACALWGEIAFVWA